MARYKFRWCTFCRSSTEVQMGERDDTGQELMGIQTRNDLGWCPLSAWSSNASGRDCQVIPSSKLRIVMVNKFFVSCKMSQTMIFESYKEPTIWFLPIVETMTSSGQIRNIQFLSCKLFQKNVLDNSSYSYNFSLTFDRANSCIFGIFRPFKIHQCRTEHLHRKLKMQP